MHTKAGLWVATKANASIYAVKLFNNKVFKVKTQIILEWLRLFIIFWMDLSVVHIISYICYVKWKKWNFVMSLRITVMVQVHLKPKSGTECAKNRLRSAKHHDMLLLVPWPGLNSACKASMSQPLPPRSLALALSLSPVTRFSHI